MFGKIGLVAAVAVGASWAVPSVTHAQISDDERAREHFQAATSYFEQARYEDAEREFSESYRLSNRPILLLNIATCRERALDFAGAVEALERYLAVRPDAEDQNTIRTRIERMREMAERQRRNEVPRAAVPSSRASSGDAGLPLIVAGAVGSGLAAVAGVLAIGFYAERAGTAARWTADACWDPATSSRATLCAGERSAASSNEVGSIVSLIAAGALGAAGAVLLVIGASSGAPPANASIRCAPGLGSFACAGTF